MKSIMSHVKIIVTVTTLLVIGGHSSTSPLPRIWLSQYGYELEDGFHNLKEGVYFSAEEEFLTEENYQNDYVVKTGTHYVLSENLTNVGFTCEDNQPVYWSFFQKLPRILSPSWTISTVDLRSKNPDATAPYKNVLIIDDLSSQSYFYLPTEIIWTFTCFTDDDQYQNSVTLTVQDTFVYPDLNVNEVQEMTPEEKIVLSIIFRLDNRLSYYEKENLTCLDLTEVVYFPANCNADKEQVLLGTNETIPLNDHHYEDFEYPDELLEYGKDEAIWEGDPIQVLCFSLNAIYTGGAYAQVIWENGSVEVLEEETDERRDFKVYLDKEEIDNHPLFGDDKLKELVLADLRIYLSRAIEAEKGMVGIECVMPLWGKGEVEGWDKVGRELDILPSEV